MPADGTADQSEISVADLRARLAAAGGTVRIVDPGGLVRAAWRRAFAGAVREDPDGARRLSFSGWRSGDVVIALAPSQERCPMPLYGRPVRGPAGDDSVVNSAVDINPSRRALRLIAALSREAKRRGHQIGTAQSAGRRPCDICIIVRGREFPLAVTAHGRALVLALPSHFPGRRTWTDGKRAKVEQKLDHVLDSLEFRAELAEQRRAEWERAEAHRRAALQPLLDRARQDYLRDRHRQALQELAAQWRTACDVQALCDAARASAAQGDLTGERTSAAQAFAQWAETHAAWIDPLCQVAAMPDLKEPTMEDLAPYLTGYDEMRELL